MNSSFKIESRCIDFCGEKTTDQPPLSMDLGPADLGLADAPERALGKDKFVLTLVGRSQEAGAVVGGWNSS